MWLAISRFNTGKVEGKHSHRDSFRILVRAEGGNQYQGRRV